jgi:hypothetical protein
VTFGLHTTNTLSNATHLRNVSELTVWTPREKQFVSLWSHGREMASLPGSQVDHDFLNNFDGDNVKIPLDDDCLMGSTS